VPEQTNSRQQIAIYLLLVFAFSSIFYFLVLKAHTLGAGAGLYVSGIMWCPALASITTLKLNGRNLTELGWKSREKKKQPKISRIQNELRHERLNKC
jgi:uncharacterized protein